MSTAPHRAVFFDLGGTLFSYGSFRDHLDTLCERMARGRGIAAPSEILQQRYRTSMLETMLEYAGRSYYLHRDMFNDAHVRFLSHFDVVARPEDPDVQLASGETLEQPGIAARPDAADTLAELRARGLHVAVVSNIDDDQLAAVWPGVGLAELVDSVTTSEEARSCKPDPGIYRLALTKAGNPHPASVVFVGDSVAHDVAGANALGMTSVLIGALPADPGAERTPSHVIENLAEVLDVLRV